MAAEVPKLSPDVLITEATYGVQGHEAQVERERRSGAAAKTCDGVTSFSRCSSSSLVRAVIASGAARSRARCCQPALVLWWARPRRRG